MQTKQLNDTPQTFALILDPGDEVMESLLTFARDHGLTGAHFTAIGALSDATLGYFSRQVGDYKKIPVREQVEVLVLAGDIALEENEPKVHAHLVLGREDGSALGGHLLQAHVWPTLEIILTEEPSHMRRRHDPRTGLALIDLNATGA